MANSGVRLEIKYKDVTDDLLTISFPYADDEASVADVKALADGIITNGTIFERVPVTKISAAFIVTEVTDVDVIS